MVVHYASAHRDLPWRRTADPYAIWVSEVMLQQTRVATVIPYWERWLAAFPTIAALAAAPLDDVLARWSGLGYYSRARNLWRGAQQARAGLPTTARELRGIAGIGPYTAGAIASIAFGERTPVVDGNVARVVARVDAIEDDIKTTAGHRVLWVRTGEVMAALPGQYAPGDLNQGWMELGATVCSARAPRCTGCPLASLCRANLTGRTDELPRTRARLGRDQLPTIARSVVWLFDDAQLVLARRREGGLFGGLWELPSRELAEQLGARIDPAPVAYHDQVLTHRRLAIEVLRGELTTAGVVNRRQRLRPLTDPSYDAWTRVSLAGARRLGIAAATTAIIRKYEDDPWSSIAKRSPSSPRDTKRSSRAFARSATTPPTRTSAKPRRGQPKGSTSSSTTNAKSRSR